MSTTMIDTPVPTTLSHLFRLIGEQRVTDKLLNDFFKTGVLARVLQADPRKVNLPALERVLGLAPALEEIMRPLLVNLGKPVEMIIKEHGIITDDNRHTEVYLPCSSHTETLATVFTHLPYLTYGRVMRAEANRGVRSADLRELLTFVTQYDLDKIGDFPLFTLGSRLGGTHPELFYSFKKGGKTYLKHVDSYAPFSSSSHARFLGVVIEGFKLVQ